MVLEALTKKQFKFQVGHFKKLESPKKLQQKKRPRNSKPLNILKGFEIKLLLQA